MLSFLFKFKPLCESDIDYLYHWFQEPIINQWYARGKNWSYEDLKQKYLPRIRGKDNIPSFIIYKNEHPIGFIQYYCLSEHFPEGIQSLNHALFESYQPSELVGLDLFVAEKNNRERGFGEHILNQFVLKLPLSTKAVVVDPEINNHRAIRCYVKAGFRPTHYSEDETYLLLLKTVSK